MKIWKRIIIYLFEKYCFGDWATEQQSMEEDSLMKKYGCKDKQELNEILLDLQQEPYREAYKQGCEDGYNKATQ